MLGNYYALKMADLQKAQEYMRAAIEIEPLRHEYRMDFVGMLMAANKLDDAERQLAEARKIDRYGIHRKQIESEAERIAFIRKQLEAPK